MDKVRVNGVGPLRDGAARFLIFRMDKPVTTAPEAAAVPEVPPAAAPTKPAPAAEVAAPAPPAAKAKSEKALKLAQALRDNLKRRKAAVRSAGPARPSN